MSAAYLDEAMRVGRTAWSMWNRDPGSPSYGSFDRPYWGWKYKDFGDATLQYAVRLALAYASRRGATSVLPALLEAWVDHCSRIQHRNGSFDQAYPFERTPGVVLDILSTLVHVRDSAWLRSDAARARLDRVAARAADFACRSDELHGEIANHFAQYAWELLFYGRRAGDDAARRKGLQYLDRTLALACETEGWFSEYGGPDAGYQTRTLRYLVKIATLEERDDVWRLAARGARFVRALAMPDGSIHPLLGNRATALVYPSAFELLASRDAGLVDFRDRVREAWREGRVPLPSTLDFGTAIRLGDDALDAAEAAGTAAAHPEHAPAHEPETMGLTDLPRAGIAIHRAPDRVCYVAYRLGGAAVVYRRDAGRWRLALEDGGYLLHSSDRRQRWLTHMPDGGKLVEASAGRLEVEARFCRSLHDDLDPWRLIALRLLNLTVLRSQWLGDLFRKVVVAALMGQRTFIPVRLRRRVSLDHAGVAICDEISGEGRLAPALASGRLARVRRATGIHMASARYFDPHELEELPVGWTEVIDWREGRAQPRPVRIECPEETGS